MNLLLRFIFFVLVVAAPLFAQTIQEVPSADLEDSKFPLRFIEEVEEGYLFVKIQGVYLSGDYGTPLILDKERFSVKYQVNEEMFEKYGYARVRTPNYVVNNELINVYSWEYTPSFRARKKRGTTTCSFQTYLSKYKEDLSDLVVPPQELHKYEREDRQAAIDFPLPTFDLVLSENKEHLVGILREDPITEPTKLTFTHFNQSLEALTSKELVYEGAPNRKPNATFPYRPRYYLTTQIDNQGNISNFPFDKRMTH